LNKPANEPAHSNRPPRIGILGGSFDPPHVGHLALARTAKAYLQLDQLIVLPTGEPWHKAAPRTPAALRARMTQLCFSNEPRCTVDLRELDRSGPTYTVDTLRELRQEHPQAALILLMGSDQFRRFDSWKDYQEILKLSHLAVTQRELVSLQNLAQVIDNLMAQYGKQALSATLAGDIVVFSMPPVAVSSTALRAQLTAESEQSTTLDAALLQPLIADSVLQFIRSEQIYTRQRQ
jgi:nicotinate-nucleotide adenylyltransferase